MKTIESALNFLSYEELEMFYISKYQCLIKKILEAEKNNAYSVPINKLSEIIAGLEFMQSEKRVLGISYLAKRNIYVAEKTIKGKYYFIKSSNKYEIVEKALFDFCKEHEIDPYERKYS